ncbi:hypothetical protein KSP40_PGU017636 [Platanthera guangdongensis]|uniref:Uncharacterized protein n=1 Tax=Platanthera guangdongensis TaxID=2320717 RepID=A0ABR2M8Z6_9ASPA
MPPITNLLPGVGFLRLEQRFDACGRLLSSPMLPSSKTVVSSGVFLLLASVLTSISSDRVLRSSLLEKLRICFLGQSASAGHGKGGANHKMPTVEENIELIMLNSAYIGARDYVGVILGLIQMFLWSEMANSEHGREGPKE